MRVDCKSLKAGIKLIASSSPHHYKKILDNEDTKSKTDKVVKVQSYDYNIVVQQTALVADKPKIRKYR